jgi:hypothetical protein
MNASPAPRQSFTVGLDALAAQCAEQQARHEEQQAQREKAAQERGAYRPRPIDMGLLPHTIPAHVDALLACSAWDHEVPEGIDRNQKPLSYRICQVALSLVVRGFTAEEFLAEMPDYTPRPLRGRYCRDQVMTSRRQNIVWAELSTRRGQPRDPAHLVVEAFKWAEDTVGRGFLLDVDQPPTSRH